MARLMMILLVLLLPVFSNAQQPFSGFDLDLVTSLKANYTTTISKLNSQTYTGTCQDQQRELNRLKMADLERRSEQADYSIALAIQQDDSFGSIYGDMLLPALNVEIAEYNLKICRVHQGTLVYKASESGRHTQQLSCYRDAQLQLHRAKIEWDIIDSKYANSPEQAYLEKIRSYDSKMVYVKCD